MELMKRTALVVAFCLSATAPLFADGTNVLTDEKSRLSYSIGIMLANRWKEQGVDVDPGMVLRGLKDAQSGAQALMSQQEMHDIIDKFQKALAEKRNWRIARQKQGRGRGFSREEQNPARRRDAARRIAIQGRYRWQWGDTRRQ